MNLQFFGWDYRAAEPQFAKMWNWPKDCRFGVVRFYDGVKPVATVSVQFSSNPDPELNRQFGTIANSSVHCYAFSPSGSIWRHLEASVLLFRVAELFSYSIQPILHFADVESFQVALYVDYSSRCLN